MKFPVPYFFNLRTLSVRKVIVGKMLIFVSALDFQAVLRQSGINLFEPKLLQKSFLNPF